MGKSKKGSSEKKNEAKLLKKEKQLLKARKKESKQDGTKDDILQLLGEYEKKIPKSLDYGKFVLCEQPSPRAMASVTCLPTGDLFFFGGEFFDGASVNVYNETYRWNIDKNEWKRLEGHPLPKPRCSHQAVLYNDMVYIFGGEFSTMHQFYHFRDLWRFCLKTNLWQEVQCTGTGPSARSGHRMVVYKNQLVVFGGFYDSARDTRYYNDLHVLSLQTFKWTRVPLGTNAHIPSPRSGVIMAAHPQGQGIFVMGGYCKLKENNRGAQGKSFSDAWWINMAQLTADLQSKTFSSHIWEKLGHRAALPSTRSGVVAVTHKALVLSFGGVTDNDTGGTSLKSIFYNDILAFDMERRRWFTISIKKKKPNCTRGASKLSATKSEGGSVPTCPAYQATKRVDYALENRETMLPAHLTDSDTDDKSLKEEDEDETTFGYIDLKGKLVRIKLEPSKEDDLTQDLTFKCPSVEVPMDNNLSVQDPIYESPLVHKGIPSESPREQNLHKNDTLKTRTEVNTKESEKEPEDILLAMDLDTPLPRFSPLLCMKNNDLIVYGGLVEIKNMELTLDDCWSFNMNIRAQWKRVLPGHLDKHPWNAKDDTDEDSESTDSDSSSISEEELSWLESSSSESSSSSSCSENEEDRLDHVKEKKKKIPSKGKMTLRERMETVQAKINALPHSSQLPLQKETLSSFFRRTEGYWVNVALIHNEKQVGRKELKRDAFSFASEHYYQLEPLREKLERYETHQAKKENA